MNRQIDSIEEEQKIQSPIKLTQVSYVLVGEAAVGKTSMAKVFAG